MGAVIDLTDGSTRLRRLSRKLLDLVGRSDLATTSLGIYYISSESEFSPLARFVERDVFLRVFGNDDRLMDREYDPFEKHSFFVLAIDHVAAEPVGVIRVILPTGAQKTVLDLEQTPGWGVTFEEICEFHGIVGSDQLWDIATLAIREGWNASRNGGLVSAGLYHCVYRASLMAGVSHWMFALDENVASLLGAAEIPLRRACELPSVEYLGSPATAPYVLHLDEVAATARYAGSLLRLFVYADGLAPEVSLPPVDLRTSGTVEPTSLEPQGGLLAEVTTSSTPSHVSRTAAV